MRRSALLYHIIIILVLISVIFKSQKGLAQSQGETLRVDSISPNSARAGETVEISIEGEGFEEGSMAYLRNQVATLNLAFFQTEYFSSNLINATFEIPMNELLYGLYNLTVWNPDGQEYMLVNGFTVTEARDDALDAPLRIDYVSPNSGSQGETIEIEIFGDGFNEGCYVYIMNENNVLAGETLIVNSSLLRLSFEIPVGALVFGSYNVTMWNPTGQQHQVEKFTLEDGFTVTGASEGSLSIGYVSPNSGSQGGTMEIEIFGDGFVEGGLVLLRNENVTLNAGTSYVNTNLLRVTLYIPLSPLVPGLYNVTVWNSDGQEYTLENSFTVIEGESRPPEDNTLRIDSVSPNSGREGETFQLEIIGNGFGSDPDDIRIEISGATVLSEDYVSPTLVRATIWISCDSWSELDVRIRISPYAEEILRGAIAVTEGIEDCPEFRIDSVTPKSGKQGEKLQLEIVGDGFTPGIYVRSPVGITATEEYVDSQHFNLQIDIQTNFPAPQEVYFEVIYPSEDGPEDVRFYFDVERAATTTPTRGLDIPGFPYESLILGITTVILLLLEARRKT